MPTATQLREVVQAGFSPAALHLRRALFRISTIRLQTTDAPPSMSVIEFSWAAIFLCPTLFRSVHSSSSTPDSRTISLPVRTTMETQSSTTGPGLQITALMRFALHHRLSQPSITAYRSFQYTIALGHLTQL